MKAVRCLSSASLPAGAASSFFKLSVLVCGRGERIKHSILCWTLSIMSASITPTIPLSYGITRLELAGMNQDQMTEANKTALMKVNGVEGLAKLLQVSLTTGLMKDEINNQFQARRKMYGTNIYPEPPIQTWCQLFISSFNDPTLLILLLAAAVSLVVGFIEHPEQGWIEGTTIFLACLIVATVTATNDYEKDKQFRALKGESDDILIKVIRMGQQQSVSTFDINTGDVVILEAGDKIPGDCVFIEGNNCKATETSLTGEPDDCKKDQINDPFLLSGCNLVSGRCHALCIAIGEESRWGRIKAKLAVEQVPTPLQEKLDRMAALVGYFGGGMALLTFIAMMVLLGADETILERRNMTLAGYVINAFIIAVTIVVVAIPEGLPLAVTISLAYSTKKMLKDKNLIRVMAACETMGNATNICSDKTGTLTENRMTVVAGWYAGIMYDQEKGIPNFSIVPPLLKQLFQIGLSVNSTAMLEFDELKEKFATVGSKTEGALLQMVGAMFRKEAAAAVAAGGTVPATNNDPNAHFYIKERAAPTSKVFSFSSLRKLSSVLMPKEDGGYRLYVKGASEIVLSDCTTMLNQDGDVVPLDKEIKHHLVNDVITTMAKDVRCVF